MGAQEVAVPTTLDRLVERIYIHQIVDITSGQPLMRSHALKPKSSAQSFPGQEVTPQIIYELYQVNSTGSLSGSPQSSQAVAEFEEEFFYQSDLNIFQRTYNLSLQNVSTIVGINAPATGYLGEASLDVQYIMAVARNVITWDFSFLNYDLTAVSFPFLSLSLTQNSQLIERKKSGRSMSQGHPMPLLSIQSATEEMRVAPRKAIWRSKSTSFGALCV